MQHQSHSRNASLTGNYYQQQSGGATGATILTSYASSDSTPGNVHHQQPQHHLPQHSPDSEHTVSAFNQHLHQQSPHLQHNHNHNLNHNHHHHQPQHHHSHHQQSHHSHHSHHQHHSPTAAAATNNQQQTNTSTSPTAAAAVAAAEALGNHLQRQHQQLQDHLNQQDQDSLHQYEIHHTIDSTTLGSTHGQSKKSVDKGSDEYKKRRERNNVAVRKSREKAKLRSRETERRVAELSKENQLYRAQYEELRREFNVLKSLLLKTGLTEQVIEDEAQRHTSNNIQQQLNSHVSNNVHNHMVVASNHHHHHHLVNSLNNQVDIKGMNCVNQVVTTTANNNNNNSQLHYTSATLEAIDQWTADEINSYV